MKPSLPDLVACSLIVLVPLAFLWVLSGEILSLLGRVALALSGVP